MVKKVIYKFISVNLIVLCILSGIGGYLPAKTVKADSLVIEDDDSVILVLDNSVLGVTTSPTPSASTSNKSTNSNQSQSLPPPSKPSSDAPPPTQNQPQTSNSSPSQEKKPITKTVPLVPANSASIIQATPSNDKSKLQVIIRQLNIPPNPTGAPPQPQNNHPSIPTKSAPASTTSSNQPKLSSPSQPGSVNPSNPPTPTSQASSKVTPIPTLTSLQSPLQSISNSNQPLPASQNSSILAPTNSTSNTNPSTIKQSVNQIILQGSNKQPLINIKPDQQNQIIIQQGNTQVSTNLPIQISTQNHSLSVITSNGNPTLNVLPKEAINGVISQKIIDSPPVSISTSNQTIKLNEENGNLVYTIDGQKSGQLFGIIPVSSPVEVKLSAQTGKVITVNQSPISSILGIFIK